MCQIEFHTPESIVTPIYNVSGDSNTAMDAGGDGLLHRTAWAEAGDAVLFHDPENSGEITGKRQYVFTEWDPTATSDMEALRAVFDTNGDGVLDINVDTFVGFKLLVTDFLKTLRVYWLSAIRMYSAKNSRLAIE